MHFSDWHCCWYCWLLLLRLLLLQTLYQGTESRLHCCFWTMLHCSCCQTSCPGTGASEATLEQKERRKRRHWGQQEQRWACPTHLQQLQLQQKLLLLQHYLLADQEQHQRSPPVSASASARQVTLRGLQQWGIARPLLQRWPALQPLQQP